MAYYCTHCGSRNHRAIDCSKKHHTYTPSAEELAQMEGAKAAPLPAPSITATSGPVRPISSPAQTPTPGEHIPLVPHPYAHHGYPPFCPIAQLPAYPSTEAIKTICDSLCTGIVRTWQCGDHWHCEPKHHSPTGQSSGNERDSRLPKNFTPFIRPAFLAQIRKAHGLNAQGELPQQTPRTPEPAKKSVAPPPARAVECTTKQDSLL